ncbi:hypothetical protein [Paraburkholderia saeva]|uniref:Uncharacterized protein n=1 Tax=Paraburkholderia saeva TaxID=2777537 RepID=A0A9N8RZ46_9BURK|nr:hypothetical protein [Paraburkholderia saeva]CAG4906327.1 hypothetical protein LMG31841_03547 [Paraburkholderia saeva]
MRTNLSPIAQHLILILNECVTCMTAKQLRAKLPDADEMTFYKELQMLVSTEVFRRGLETKSGELAYWLTANVRPNGVADVPAKAWTERGEPTMADVAGIRTAGDHCVQPIRVSVENDNRRRVALPSAPGLLAAAEEHMRDRAAQYDKPEGERSMGTTVIAFNAITGRNLAEAEGWLLLQLLKDVRLFQRPGYHADSAEDCIAYAALKAEAKGRETAPAKEANHA